MAVGDLGGEAMAMSKEKRTLELARVTEVTSIADRASADRGTYPAKGSHDGRLVSPSLPDHGRNASTIANGWH